MQLFIKGNRNNDVNFTLVNFQFFTQRKKNMKNTIIWDVSPCYPLEIYREFIRTCFLRLQIRGVCLSATLPMGFTDFGTRFLRLLH